MVTNMMELTDTIVTCCEDINLCMGAVQVANAAIVNQIATELGTGLSEIALSWKECCLEDIVTINVPAVVDADGNELQAAYTKTGPSQFAAACLQSQAWNTQTGSYVEAYNMWLEEWQAYQDAQIVPLLGQLLLNLGLVYNMINLYNTMLGCVNDLLDGIKEEQTALKDLSVGHLIPAVEMHCDMMLSKFASSAALQAYCDSSGALSANGQNMFDCFLNQYKPDLTAYNAGFSMEAAMMHTCGKNALVDMKACIADLEACLEEAHLNPAAEDPATYKTITQTAYGKMQNLIARACEGADKLEACCAAIEAHWQNGACNDPAFMKDSHTIATELVNCLKTEFTNLELCRDDFKAFHELAYFAKESVHIPAMLEEACVNVTCQTECNEFLKLCADQGKSRYASAYMAKEHALAQVAMQEACDLEPCFSDVKDCLVQYADEMINCWRQWKDKEITLLCDQLEKADILVCEMQNKLGQFCNNGDGFLEFFRSCYEDAECFTSPKLIEAAERACAKQEMVYNSLCDKMDHLWGKFNETWCPCDERDLLEFCACWETLHPLNELKENHECLQSMGDLLKDCYKDLVLPWEKEYIEEICNMEKYDPKYCEMEDAALLHIRMQFDKEAERAIKVNPRYCTGATKQQLINIQNARIRAEAAALQNANRYERWMEIQECNRRHRYTMDVLERLGKRYPELALEYYAQDNNLLDTILVRMHERLVRGYEYMRGTREYGATVMDANARAVDAGIRTILAGHEWVNKYCRVNETYYQATNTYVSNTQQHAAIAQGYAQEAGRNKERASQTINQSAQWGYNHAQLGHEHIKEALDAKRIGIQNSANIQTQALQAYEIGQRYLGYALDAQTQANQLAQTGLSNAQQSSQNGYNYASLAADKADNMVKNAIAAAREGTGLMEHYRGMHQVKFGSYQTAINAATNEYGQFINNARNGLEAGRLGMMGYQESLRSQAAVINEACSFLSQNHCCTADGAMATGALNTATGLLAGATQGIQQGMNGFLSSLTQLNQPPAPPVLPGGGFIPGAGATGVTGQ